MGHQDELMAQRLAEQAKLAAEMAEARKVAEEARLAAEESEKKAAAATALAAEEAAEKQSKDRQAAIDVLVEMGFEKENVEIALEFSNWNPQKAVLLLMQQSFHKE